MEISRRRVVSPPAKTHPNFREARRRPAKNSSSQRPVWLSGSARLRRKQRGTPPIAAMSLTARARHFQPRESGGCSSWRKWVPSRNQSQVRIISWLARGRKSAASSPMPRRTSGETSPRRRNALSILSIRSLSRTVMTKTKSENPCLFPCVARRSALPYKDIAL